MQTTLHSPKDHMMKIVTDTNKNNRNLVRLLWIVCGMVLLAGIRDAGATAYTFTPSSTGGVTTSWTASGAWNNGSGYPGSNAADTALITNEGFTTNNNFLALTASETFSSFSMGSGNSGTVSVTSLGSNVTTLTVNSMSFSSGTLVFRNSNSGAGTGTLSVATSGLTVSGGTLDIGTFSGTGNAILLNSFTVNGSTSISSGAVNIQNTTSTTGAQNVDLGDVTMTGGTLNLGVTSASTFNNTVLVRSLNGTTGTIQVNTGTATNGATLVVSGTSNNSFSGTIKDGSASHVLSLTKSGSNTQTLGGNNTYSGGTLINQGALLVNNTSGSATGTGGVTVSGTSGSVYGVLGGGATASNGGVLGSLRGGATLKNYNANSIGMISGTVTVNQYGALAPGNSVGTLTVGALTLNTGSVLNYEFNATANDFTSVGGALTLASGIKINLYQEGGTTAFATTGVYNLFGYGSLSGFSASDFTVANAQAGWTYTFSNDSTDKLIQLTVAAVPEPSAVALLLATGSATLFLVLRRRKH